MRESIYCAVLEGGGKYFSECIIRSKSISLIDLDPKPYCHKTLNSIRCFVKSEPWFPVLTVQEPIVQIRSQPYASATEQSNNAIRSAHREDRIFCERINGTHLSDPQMKANNLVLLDTVVLPVSERGFPHVLLTVLRRKKRKGKWAKWLLYP